MAELKHFDLAGSYLQALAGGRQMRAHDEQRQDRLTLRDLAAGAIGGDPDAQARAYAIDPNVGKAYSGAADQRGLQIRGMAKAMHAAVQSGDPAKIQALHSAMRPDLQRLTGQAVPEQFDPATMMPNLEKVLATTEHLESGANGKPAEQRFLEWLGSDMTPEQVRHMKEVEGGIRARPPTGGYGFDKLTDAQGRERPTRRNPRTGQMDVWFDEQGWTPMGGGGDAPPMGPQGAPAPSGGPAAAPPSGSTPNVMAAASMAQTFGGRVTSGYRDPAKNARVDGVANSQHMKSTALDVVFTNPQARSQYIAWMKGNGWEHVPEGDHDHFELPPSRSAPRPAPLPISLASQSPEEKKYDEAYGGKRGEAAAELDIKNDKRERDADRSVELLSRVIEILPNATGGMIGAGKDKVLAAGGKSTAGARANAQLKLYAAELVGNVPRFEGPQSNIDVQFYKDAAGDLANENLPAETRLAAAKEMLALKQKYATTPAPKSAPASSKTWVRGPDGKLTLKGS